MAAKGRGGGKTPERVIELLQNEVDSSSQAATARNTGLALQTVQNYIKGIGEPSQATLKKLADYFGLTVEFLRGEGDFNYEEMSELLNVRSDTPVGVMVRIIEAVVTALVKRGAILPKEGTPERVAYIRLIKEHVARECSEYMKYVWGDRSSEIDKILGVDEEEFRAGQIRYIVQAAKMATDEELGLMAEQAGAIINKHCS